MQSSNIFLLFQIESGLLHEHNDGNFRTLVFGFAPFAPVALPEGFTHMGIVVRGAVTVSYPERERFLQAGDYFSVVGAAMIRGDGAGIVNSAYGYCGFNAFGGPLEERGKLRYIDGCSDSLIVPPVRRGDPCLNHLHFPVRIRQTPHTHPSVRTGVIYQGAGECIVPDRGGIPLLPGYAFVIPTNSVHSFNTDESSLDVIAFHPDSDAGMTDDDHPMINRTFVDGVSAKYIPAIRTVAQG